MSWPAFAACTGPSGVSSQTRYDFAQHKMFICNGTDWLEIPGGGSGGFGCVLDGVVIDDGDASDFYSATSHANCASVSQTRTCTNGELSGNATFQYAACSTADTTPDAFSFNDVTNAPLNTLTTPSPATVTISGINASTPVSVSGQGTPRISINGGAWVASGSITNGQTLAVRLTSAAANSTAYSAIINVGGVTDNWSVTTAPPTCTPGETWTPRESNRNWRDVASSADGTKLVATVTSGQIYTSTDSGVSWTPRDSNRGWYGVASSADGTKLAAVEWGGQVYTSANSGVSWTPRDSSRVWSDVASSADGTKLVATVMSGQIYTSTNSGVSWTPRDSSRDWWEVASSADGTKLVAVVTAGQIYTSTDSGVNWTPRESNQSWRGVASSADGTKLVAAYAVGQIYTSTNSGVSWTPREINRAWYDVASSADGTKLVAVHPGGKIYTSTDSGVSWTPRESDRNWHSVASSADGTKLVAVVYGGQIYTSSCP